MTQNAEAVPRVMEAIVLNEFGGIDHLVRAQRPVPVPGLTEILIRVSFAGIGSWDAEERQGDYDAAFGYASTFPYILGWDGAGTVAAVGKEVNRLKLGDEVYAATMPLPRGGFYAEYTVVDQEYASHIPKGLSHRDASVIAWDALTAQTGLDELGLAPDETVMILGASGGIGHFAVQLAKERGLKVLAVASGPDGVALAQRLGADVAIDGHQAEIMDAARKFAPQGLKGAFVTFGGELADRAVLGVQGSGIVAVPHGVKPVPKASLSNSLRLFNAKRNQRAFDQLNRAIASGGLAVHVDHTLEFHRFREAHRLLETHYLGKIALRIATP